MRLTDYPGRQRPRSGAVYKVVNIGRQRYLNLCGGDTSDGSPVLGWPIAGREAALNEKVYSVFKLRAFAGS